MNAFLSILLLGLILCALPAAAARGQDLATLEALRAQAERGDADAQLELGILYEFGFHLPDNKAPALAWYRLAAEQGHAKAAARHDALKAKMTPAELAAAERLYETWRARIPAAAKNPAPTEPPAP
jgi:TPR repeat protein